LIFVVDASAAVEHLLQTPLGTRVEALLRDADLVAPELLDAEVLSVLRREVASGRLEAGRAAEAVDDLRAWSIERLPHRPLLREAWSLRGHVTAYDALYVAAARARNADLVTADGPLARAPGLGVVIHDVRPGSPAD
jgi:predicted nucleic acid-binding protein